MSYRKNLITYTLIAFLFLIAISGVGSLCWNMQENKENFHLKVPPGVNTCPPNDLPPGKKPSSKFCCNNIYWQGRANPYEMGIGWFKTHGRPDMYCDPEVDELNQESKNLPKVPPPIRGYYTLNTYSD